MSKILCFIDQQMNYSGGLYEYLQKLDQDNHVVYLYTDVIYYGNNPSDIIYILDEISDRDAGESVIFLSNIYNLIQFAYRIYHQTFDSFIYFYQENTLVYPMYDIYQSVLNIDIVKEERLYKVIYSNCEKFVIGNFFCPIKNLNLVFQKKEVNSPVSGFQKNESDERTLEPIKKIFGFKGKYYFFEPVLAEKSIIINIERDKTIVYEYLNNQNANNGAKNHHFLEINFMFSYNEELCSMLNQLLDKPLDYLLKAYETLELLEVYMKEYKPCFYKMTCCRLEYISVYGETKNIIKELFLLSFLMQITKQSFHFKWFLEYVLRSEVLFGEHKYYAWNQAKRFILINQVYTDIYSDKILLQLYEDTYISYKEKLFEKLSPISMKERDMDTIIVFTNQFLSERHAPTRTVLERCYTLQKYLNKKILLINTKEQLTKQGMFLLYHPSSGNIEEKYNEVTQYLYKDAYIPFYQPYSSMPSLGEIEKIVSKVRELKPAFILSIGNGNITADLCGNVIPEVAIGVAFSTLPTSMATLYVIGKNLSDNERNQYWMAGYNRESIIESTFTFELSIKERSFTREEMNIPEEKFILVTVGIRLDAEIDDEFIEMVNNTFSWGTHIVFAGIFENYKIYCKKYPELKEHSTFVGYCNDMLALMEICDLYINPKRLGGGFSIVEAFHEGKPGISLNYGDVSAAAGKEFCVYDYCEMKRYIKSYVFDKQFYRDMSRKAIAREKIVTNSVNAMSDILDKIVNNPLFF